MTSLDSNPLLQTWTTPFGLPPFASIRPEHFEPAFAEALRSHRAEIAAIANDASPATFDNTLVAFDKAGRVLSRIEKVFFNLTASETSPALQAVEREMSPRLAAHHSAIYLDAALFARIDALHHRRGELGLDAGTTAAVRARPSRFRARRRATSRTPRTATRPSSSASRRCRRDSARTCWPTKRTTACRCRTSATSPACPRTCAPRHARRRSSAATTPTQ